jgi:predicted acetyltransferase
MYSLMGFLGKLCSNVKQLIFKAPPEMHPELIWQEPYDLKTEVHTNGMARIINAQKALQVIRKNSPQGEFTVQIHDDFMEQNDKSYKVSWSDGKTEVIECDDKCDLECSIQALAQLVTGVLGIDSALARKDGVVHDNYEMLRSVFVKKDVFIADYF